MPVTADNTPLAANAQTHRLLVEKGHLPRKCCGKGRVNCQTGKRRTSLTARALSEIGRKGRTVLVRTKYRQKKMLGGNINEQYDYDASS